MLQPYEWTVIRLIPRIERGELINVGVIVYCRNLDFLEAAVELDESRALALDPNLDLDAVRAHLRSIQGLCVQDPAVGPNASRPAGERFRWLTAPRSTMVQASVVHTGLTADPAGELERLATAIVRPL